MSIDSNPNLEEENLENKEDLAFKEDLDKALSFNAKMNEENGQLKDQLLRLAADSENLRKRAAKQIEDAGKFAVNSFSKDMIEVLENLYLATNNIPAAALEEENEFTVVFKGIEMTKQTLLNVFEKHGIKRILPEVGGIFDHNLHQAVAQVEQADFAENSIVNVMRAGYVLHDRLIKPAMVIVAKAK